MVFEIEVDTARKRFTMQVERTYGGESLERFRVSYGDRFLVLQSNRPLLIATKSTKHVKWQLLEGEIKNPNTQEVTMTLFRMQKAIEAHMKAAEKNA